MVNAENRLLVVKSIKILRWATLLAAMALGMARLQAQILDAGGMATRRFPPVDEASRCPGFVEFRQRLRDIVVRKDAKALLEIVHPDIRFSFGPENGRDAFKKRWIDSTQDGDVWLELNQLLNLGGRCSDGSSFTAPYVFADWPSDLDAFQHGAITGSRVRLREAPSLDAPVITLLDFEIVRVDDWGDGANPWLTVTVPDGPKGFIARRYVRSGVDMRAFFSRENGSWRMILFVQGD